MIYEFKSRATGSVIMTSEAAEHLLKFIGKEPGPTGIITVAQIPAAIAALRDDLPASKSTDDNGDDNQEQTGEDSQPKVSMMQRAFPLIEMLTASLKADKDVTWGV